MNQSKKIEIISKSSLVSLKAELLRKQDEVKKAKLDPKNQIGNFVPSSIHQEGEETVRTVPEKITQKRDAEESEALRKSKAALEKKTKLYDHLSEGNVSSEHEALFLVNFKDKSGRNKRTNYEESDDEPEETQITEEAEGEWVDYIDCLGRTRRCHVSDLDHLKEQDDTLHENLYGKKPSQYEFKRFIKEKKTSEEPVNAFKQKLQSRWDQKEEELLKKDTVYYEDVLFDEARTHGVGYYALSADEEVRKKQQAELKNISKETDSIRAATAELRANREQAIQQRVKAARARQRARAGLPPEEETEAPPVTTLLLDFVEQQKKISIEAARKEREAKEDEAKKEREKYVREWDVGKEGLREAKSRVLSQEEWVDKKRKERVDEFAPPSISRKNNKEAASFSNKGFYVDTEGDADLKDSKSNVPSFKNPEHSLYFTTKKKKDEIKNKYYDPSVNAGTSFQPTPIRDECDRSKDKPSKNERGAGAEIEPPVTYDYYGPVNQKKRRTDARVNLPEAIEMGLENLKKRAIEKDIRKNHALIDEC